MELTILILLLPFLSFPILGIGGKWMSHRTAGAIGTLILGAVVVPVSYTHLYQCVIYNLQKNEFSLGNSSKRT